MKPDAIQKQEKILKKLSLFSEKKLSKITADDYNFEKMSRKDSSLFMDCIWITLGKEEITEKELKQGIKEILTVAILELFRRQGLVKINKIGNFDKTKLGEEVLKSLENLK